MGRPSRQPSTPAPAVADEAELAHRYEWLIRWVTLTVHGEGVLVEHRGTLAQRVEHLERELDRVGKRDAAEAFLRSLEAGAQRTREHIEALKQQGYGP
jgi:hypothetical protein